MRSPLIPSLLTLALGVGFYLSQRLPTPDTDTVALVFVAIWIVWALWRLITAGLPLASPTPTPTPDIYHGQAAPGTLIAAKGSMYFQGSGESSEVWVNETTSTRGSSWSRLNKTTRFQ